MPCSRGKNQKPKTWSRFLWQVWWLPAYWVPWTKNFLQTKPWIWCSKDTPPGALGVVCFCSIPKGKFDSTSSRSKYVWMPCFDTLHVTLCSYYCHILEQLVSSPKPSRTTLIFFLAYAHCGSPLLPTLTSHQTRFAHTTRHWHSYHFVLEIVYHCYKVNKQLYGGSICHHISILFPQKYWTYRLENCVLFFQGELFGRWSALSESSDAWATGLCTEMVPTAPRLGVKHGWRHPIDLWSAAVAKRSRNCLAKRIWVQIFHPIQLLKSHSTISKSKSSGQSEGFETKTRVNYGQLSSCHVFFVSSTPNVLAVGLDIHQLGWSIKTQGFRCIGKKKG